VDLDDTGAEVHQPGLRHPGAGVEGQLDVPVVGDASVGHVDYDQGVPRLRNSTADPHLVEDDVRVVLSVLAEDERVLHAHHKAAGLSKVRQHAREGVDRFDLAWRLEEEHISPSLLTDSDPPSMSSTHEVRSRRRDIVLCLGYGKLCGVIGAQPLLGWIALRNRPDRLLPNGVPRYV